MVSKVAQGVLNLIVLDEGREMLQEEQPDKGLVTGISCHILPVLLTSQQTHSAKQVGLQPLGLNRGTWLVLCCPLQG